ncbi:hypothetical protein ES677_09090 [Bizionia gelidisalsuginis]|uniref:Tetratricopeptide repeat protein n=2 Tax=Bizionia TaxID=283785 RepID=A0A8H2LH50_9FLAO|nr:MULTISPECIES: hypothetical protein [Bizionia]TYB78102.1 hypothetical protein ES676_02500 [Bizionia saleffrena]TYC12120.1 hypothetical protein ES677_09090 [Bizionia gelidisalsuginis]
MKTKITVLIAVLFLGLNVSFGQNEEACRNKLSIMVEYARSKNYETAYKPFMELRQECPKYNKAIYVFGEKILKDKIDNTTGVEQVAFINDLVKLWDERALNFANETPKGEYDSKQCQLKYDYKTELGLTDDQLYSCFDAAFTADKETFENPKSLYVYFKLMVNLYDTDKKTAQELFDKYDDVVEKIEFEVEKASVGLNKIVTKEEAGAALTKKEGQYQRYYTSVLSAFDQISGSVDSELGNRANCENLIPLYEKSFEANKANATWLQRAAGRMSAKECTSDPLFFKLVNAYHDLSPSANSAYYLGILKDKEGKSSEARGYYEQAISLETDNFKKAKLYKKIAIKLKAVGNYGQARTYYMNAVNANPSDKSPHLQIAGMYSSSAKNCGTDNFSQRAVFWLAAAEARKAGSSNTAARYEGLAPSNTEIFNAGNAGKSITIGCWIQRTVTVPNI